MEKNTQFLLPIDDPVILDEIIEYLKEAKLGELLKKIKLLKDHLPLYLF